METKESWGLWTKEKEESVATLKICPMVRGKIPKWISQVQCRLSQVQTTSKRFYKPLWQLRNRQQDTARTNLWTTFRMVKKCQTFFSDSCGSALTSHGLVRAQEVTTCTRLSKWKISDEFRKQHMIKTALHTLLRLLRCPGRDGPQDFQLPFPRWPNFASAFQTCSLEFAYPFSQGFPTQRWCTRRCLS